MKWDIVAGCEDPKMAMKRAAAIVAARPLDGRQSTNSGFFTIAVHPDLAEHAPRRGRRRTVDAGRDEVAGQLRRQRAVPDPPRQSAGSPRVGADAAEVLPWEGRGNGVVCGDDGLRHPGRVHTAGGAGRGVSDTGGAGGGHHAPPPHPRTPCTLVCKGETSPAASVFTALVESLYRCASDDATRAGACVPPLELILDEAAKVCAIRHCRQ